MAKWHKPLDFDQSRGYDIGRNKEVMPPNNNEKIMYAFRDQARLYRRLRRDVLNGAIDHYTVDECDDKIKEANDTALYYEQLDETDE